MQDRIDARPGRPQPLVAHRIRPLLQDAAFALRPERGCLLAVFGGAGIVVPTRHPPFRAEAPRLLWLPPGDATGLRLQAGSTAEMLEIPEPFLARAAPAGAFGDEVRRALGRTLMLPLDEEPTRRRLALSFEAIREELDAAAAGYALAVEHQLSLAFIRLWRLARAQGSVAAGGGRTLLDRFVLLVGLHAREHWGVGDYCAALGVSRDRLGRAVQGATGLSPQGYVHRELHREARELLLESTLPVSQIAFRLGFSDPAYFNRFFRRIEGVAPGRLRRAQRSRARADGSFAAWP